MSATGGVDAVGTALHSALTGLAMRQRVVSDNVANIQTPGFRAGRVDFEGSLREALASGPGDTAVAPTVARSAEPTRLDGNNVNLDRETLAGVETTMRYQLTLRVLDERYGVLRTAIGSR